ncbi:uncharacterized protein LOC134271156 [Saccostrea cucullata]|uniref:uncharacterized protein LOC134271156 n=1 Tax=Saccostrea cuccullata TaxID=36930 RepID=UPI002ED4CEEF
MQPDGMHTIADFISHVLDMLTGKHDGRNVRNCKKKFQRFSDIWVTEDPVAALVFIRKGRKKSKPNKENESPEANLTPTPWSLSKEQLKLADARAASVTYSSGYDISPGPHFSKPWTLRTMNSKIQFVTSGALAWCIRVFLPNQQEETLFIIVNLIKRMVSPQLTEEDIPSLQEDVHTGLAMFERDFPLSMQNLVTHLLHHIVDGFSTFGPLYGRWLFPYERANGWITRQCLKKGAEESTVMETYAVYEWCMYMVMSGRFKPAKTENQIWDSCSEEITYHFNVVHGKEITLTEGMRCHMKDFYQAAFKLKILYFGDIASEVKTYSAEGRKLISNDVGSMKNCSIVKVFNGVNHLDIQFGEVTSLIEHNVNCTIQTWAIIDMFPLAEREGVVYIFERKALYQRMYMLT